MRAIRREASPSSQAIELIDPEQEPRLLLCTRHNLIDYLASAGRYLDAQRHYRETRTLYRSFPDAWSQTAASG